MVPSLCPPVQDQVGQLQTATCCRLLTQSAQDVLTSKLVAPDMWHLQGSGMPSLCAALLGFFGDEVWLLEALGIYNTEKERIKLTSSCFNTLTLKPK